MAPLPDERRKLPGTRTVPVIALGLLFLYVLSIGPAWVLYGRRSISQSTIANAYLPHWYLYQHSDSANHALDWYLDRWHSWDSPYDQPPMRPAIRIKELR